MNTIKLAGLILALSSPLSATPTEANRGPWRRGLSLTQDYVLTNRSSQVVLIENVVGSCGCLKPMLSTRQLAPGESYQLRVEVNTLAQPPGPQRWRTTVHWRCGHQIGELTLELTAHLFTEVEVEPAALALVGTADVTAEVRVRDTRPVPLAELRAECTIPGMRASVTTKGVGEWVVRVVLGDAAAGKSEGTLRLLSNDHDYPEIRVPVQLTRQTSTAFTVVPAEPVLRVTPSQPKPSVLLQAQAKPGVTFTLDRVECGPNLSVRFAQSGQLASIRVRVNDSAPAHGQEVVRVIAREPAGQVVEVPIRWRSSE